MKIFLFILLFMIDFSNSICQKDNLVNVDSLNIFRSTRNNLPISLELKKYNLNNISPLENKINYTVLTGLGTAYLAVGTFIHIYQQNAWWKDQRTNFHFMDDWDYALWIDKLGHFYGALLLQHAFSSALEASGFEAEQSTVYGSISALTFQLYVEIEDGFGPQWGFSPGDAYADILGSAFPVAQYYYPYLKNFQFRFSYYPAKLYEVSPFSNQQHIIIDDYEGQKLWLAVRIKEVLPKSISKYLPSFLMLSFGMGVSNLDGGGGGKRDLYIALDFDAESIPLFGKEWQFVKNTLNYFHFPMPGIRITNGVAFFGLCY